MYNKKFMDDCRIQISHPLSSSSPVLTILPSLTRTRKNYRFHPFSQQQQSLYRPQLNLSKKERCDSPPCEGTHISHLYPEILALIFSYLNVRDKGVAAQVCTTWRDTLYHKSVWKGVEAQLHLRRPNPTLVNSLSRRGIKHIQILSLRKSFREITQGINNLTSLNLSGCYNIKDDNFYHAFSSAIPSLIYLDLSLCKQITDKSVLKIVQVLENLEVLQLGGCSNITDSSLLAISNGLKRLKILNLRSCWNISDQGIRLLANKSDKSSGNSVLENLGLQDCQHLSDDALKHISSGLPSIKTINLNFCINISDTGLKYLAKMNSLRELNLRSCDNITDIGVAYLAEAGSRISMLDVSFCDKVTDQALDFISQGLYHLKCLSLSACHISDDGICKIAKSLSELEVLNIGQCTRVTNKSLFVIVESFRNLRGMDLYGCSKITADVLKDITPKLPTRCILNLGLWHVEES